MSQIWAANLGKRKNFVPKRTCQLDAPNGGHLKPVTLKPVIRIFRVFASAFSAFSVFSAFSFCGVSSDPCFPGWEGRPHFPHFPCIGFESLISKIRPTGFRMTGPIGDWDLSSPPSVQLGISGHNLRWAKITKHQSLVFS